MIKTRYIYNSLGTALASWFGVFALGTLVVGLGGLGAGSAGGVGLPPPVPTEAFAVLKLGSTSPGFCLGFGTQVHVTIILCLLFSNLDVTNHLCFNWGRYIKGLAWLAVIAPSLFTLIEREESSSLINAFESQHRNNRMETKSGLTS